MTSRAPCGRLAVAVAIAVAVGVLAGCAVAPTDGAREYLDERTAATITVGAPTLVFARERPELAVHARDYLTLVPIDVNRAGSHAQYFYAYVWSTIDKRGADDAAGRARFELLADGRRIPLAPVPGKPRDLGIGTPPLPAPARSVQVLLSATTREAQAFVATADEIIAVAVLDEAAEPFPLWKR
ncbi:MAG: hypothetical protein WBO04_06285 [Steroidobacteraceae bacterium]